MKLPISLLVIILFSSSASSDLATNDDILAAFSIPAQEPNLNMTVLERWQHFEKTMKSTANAVIKMVLPRIMEISGNINLSSQCVRDSMLLINGLKNIKPWAMRFLDSSAKFIDGILVGSLSSFGDYDECVDTVVHSTRSRDRGKTLFRGKYCTVDLTPPLPPKANFYKQHEVLDELKNFSQGDTVISEMSKYAHFFHFLTLRLGVCVPSGCSREDIDNVVKMVGNLMATSLIASRCEIKQKNDYSPVVIAIMTCYSFAGFMMLVGTFVDLYAYYRKVICRNRSIRVLTAFSIFTNFQKFVNTDTASDTLSCLNGVRFLCISWVILGHTYFIFNYQIFLGLEKVRAYARDFAFQVVINSSVAVDTFFFIGGLLVCYLIMKFVRLQGHKFSVVLYIFHRLWRIIPVYACVIGFMFMLNVFGSGPIWHDTNHKYIKACQDNWWTNLIFINNFYDAEHMCIPHSWYIASDFQLYVGALIIILPMLRWPKVGILLSVMVVISSIVYSGVCTYINNYPPTMLFSHPDPEQRIRYWARFYFLPFVHAGPYSIGMMTGYLLATKPDLKIPKRVQVLGWCLAFSFNFSVLYGVVEWNRGIDPSFWGALLYAAFNRVAWTLGVAWMVVTCATGHGGVINYILSWKAFVPLSRLTYLAYLIHPLVQIIYVGNIRTQLQPDHFIGVWLFFGNMCITYGASFAGSMLVEAPFLALEKILLPKDEKKTPETLSLGNSAPKDATLTTDKNGDNKQQVHCVQVVSFKL